MTEIKITLAAARVNANMTQEDTAREMKTSKNTIVNWEKGKVNPTFASLQMLANLYKIPIDCLKV